MQHKNTLRNFLLFVAVFVVASAIFTAVIWYTYNTFNVKHIEKKKDIYQPKIDIVMEIMRTEKEWIRKNQSEGGEIFLNVGDKAIQVGDVNPYFACFAAQSLLSLPSNEDMTAVKKYLKWHSEQLIALNGVVTNYKTVNESLISTGEYDSVDSYVAVLVSLLCQYAEKGGDMSEIDPDRAVLNMALTTLASLTENSITRIKPGKNVFYLMDNIEVIAAYNDLHTLAGSINGKKWLEEDCTAIQEYAKKAAELGASAVKNAMWNKEDGHFEVGVDENNKPFEFEGWNILYPYTIAQIYPIAFDVNIQGINFKGLYDKMCENISWQQLKFGDNEKFNWGIICYTSTKLNDYDSALVYLKEYKEKFKYNRDYPLHTADAGWVVKACGELYEHYNYKINSSLLQDFIDDKFK